MTVITPQDSTPPTEETTTARRLITFLGTGRKDEKTGQYVYDRTTYVFGERAAVETNFVAHALVQSIECREVQVLATDKAWKLHGEALRASLHDAGVDQVHRVPISEGASQPELWDLFRILKDLLRPPAGWEIVLDITHGFRCHPFYAAAAVAFVRSVDPAPAPISVFYGAYTGKTNPAPLQDLTPVVELLDWSRALTLFLETGRADRVVQPANTVSKSLSRQKDREGSIALVRLARALEKFSDDFATVRTGSMLVGSWGSAAALEQALQEAEGQVQVHLPPLADVLHRVTAMVQGLPSEDLGSDSGLRALARLAEVYLEKERYLEAITIVREAWVSRYADASGVNPGQKGFTHNGRLEAEQRMVSAIRGTPYDLLEVRNDMDHAGFRSGPTAARRLKAQVQQHVSKFLEALEVEPPPPKQEQGPWANLRRAIRTAWEATGYEPTPDELARLESETDTPTLLSWLQRAAGGDACPTS